MLKKSEKSVVLLLQHDQPYKRFGIKTKKAWLPYLATAYKKQKTNYIPLQDAAHHD